MCPFDGIIDNATEMVPIKKFPKSIIESNKKYEMFFWGTVDNYMSRSALYCDLKGLPKLLIQAAEYDLMAGYSARIAQKARIDGVTVTMSVYKKMWHVFQMFSGIVPEATRAIKEIGCFCNSKNFGS
jgi:acetyl esterase/lipase